MHEPIRCAALLSGGASAVRYLCANDANYGKTYRFVAALSDNPAASGIAFTKKALGIPTRVADYKEWCRKKGVGRGDLEARKAYFDPVTDWLLRQKTEFVLCSGFMLIITEPMLSVFRNRMLNVHPALLSIRNPDGTPVYRGDNVVAPAMQNGDPTGSTVHIVTAETDIGPIVAESDPLPYLPGDNPTAHQEKMKFACDGPAFKKALALLAARDNPYAAWGA